MTRHCHRLSDQSRLRPLFVSLARGKHRKPRFERLRTRLAINRYAHVRQQVPATKYQSKLQARREAKAMAEGTWF